MNQQPQIFEQLTNRNAAQKLELFRNFVNNEINSYSECICSHRVVLNINKFQIIPGQPLCNCLRNNRNQNTTFFQSILQFLFQIIQNAIEINILANHVINRLLNRIQLTNQNLESFRISLKQYQVYERINGRNLEAENLQNLENFALNNGFVNQISFTIIEFPTCFLKIVELYNGQIQDNSFNVIKGGYNKLLEFFFLAQQQQFVLNPVCFHTVNLGDQYVLGQGQCHQHLQTTQNLCRICENNIEIPQSFGKLMQYILERDENSQTRNISDLINRIIQRQINSLRLILEFFNEDYTDKIEEINLTIQQYEPIPRRQIQNIDLHLKIEVEWYKKYFLRKTFSILANLIANLFLNQNLYEANAYQNISKLLNRIEQIYLKNESKLFERYPILHKKITIQEIQGKLDDINSDQDNKIFPIEQDQYANELNILNQLEVILRNPHVLEEHLFYEQIKFRICCCFCCDTFFSSDNIISNMELYLNHTQYERGIQFQWFESFLEDSRNSKVISDMTIQLIQRLQNQNQNNVIQQN